jgi:hypothetical protein
MLSLLVSCLVLAPQLGNGPLHWRRVNDVLAPDEQVYAWGLSANGARVFHVVTRAGYEQGRLVVARADGAGRS